MAHMCEVKKDRGQSSTCHKQNITENTAHPDAKPYIVFMINKTSVNVSNQKKYKIYKYPCHKNPSGINCVYGNYNPIHNSSQVCDYLLQ